MATQTLPLEFRMLGPLEVLSPHGPVQVGKGKPRALIADLLIQRGRVVSADRLIDDLWGAEPPASARHALEVYVSQLRKAFGGRNSPLVTRAPGYALEIDAHQVDTFRFERLLERARSESDVRAVHEALLEGLALWRGPALGDFIYEPFAQSEIARLEELHQEALELRVDAELALGRGKELVAELEAMIEAHPLRERPRAQLMRALYRSGRQADALAAYRLARETLVDELGVEPGRELRELEAAILRQDESLGARPLDAVESRPRRKLVTVLFADIVGSSELAAALDAETLHDVLLRFYRSVSLVLTRHGGTPEKFIGDAVMAAFGTPLSHEDDALRAARAAIEIREAAGVLDTALEQELGVRLAVRIGLASGELLAGGSSPDAPFVAGEAITLAARLQQRAEPGEIAVDELTRRLAADAAGFEPLPQQAGYRLLDVAPPAASFRRLDAPLLGRQQELSVLLDAFQEAIDEPGLRVAVIAGPAGIGKSRLAEELVRRRSHEFTVLSGRCPPYGDGLAFWPLRDMLGSRDAVLEVAGAAPDGAPVAARLCSVLEGDDSTVADEIPWAFRRFCELVADRAPLVLVFDDLQWAEPTLLALVEHLVLRSAGHRILLLCLARDELFEDRADFLTEAKVRRVVLDPLTHEETETLVIELLGGAPLARSEIERIAASAEGNPLFVEQMLAFVTDGGGGVPPSIRALLAARLERLGPGERSVLERASVVGREFTANDVVALLDVDAVPTIPRHLASLVQRGFLRSAGAGFRFRHGLVQDAAYRAVPKGLRGALHERYAAVLDTELDELIGHHLEQAYRLGSELRPGDPHTQELAAEAGARLGSGGIRQAKRGDALGAVALLGRATALLPPTESARNALLCELGVGLMTIGEVEQADRVLDEALAAAIESADEGAELRARIELAARRVLTDPEGSADAFLDVVAQAIPALEELGDDRALGRAWMLTGWIHGGVHCRNASWAEAEERALVHYGRSGWPASACRGQLAAALYYGPTPVDEAIERCEALLAESDALAGRASIQAFLGGLAAMTGRFDEARVLVAEARRLFEELGQASEIGRICGPLAAAVHTLAGNDAAAELALRESCAIAARMHDHNHLATQAAEQADAAYRQGHLDDADTLTVLAEKHAASDDAGAQFSLRSVRAKLLASTGRFAEAEALAQSAVVLAASTDALNQYAKVSLDLAEVLRLAGRDADASTFEEHAIRLYGEKGNEAAARRARRRGLSMRRVTGAS